MPSLSMVSAVCVWCVGVCVCVCVCVYVYVLTGRYNTAGFICSCVCQHFVWHNTVLETRYSVHVRAETK